MALIRWDPMGLFPVRTVLGGFWGTPAGEEGEGYVAPRANLYEDPDKYTLLVELPGVKRDGLRLSADDGWLTVQATKDVRVQEGRTELSRECSDGTYYRRFRIGRGVDEGNIDARLADGVLTVDLPKKAEDKARAIEIH